VAGNLLASVVSLPWALSGPRAAAIDYAVILYLGVFQVGAAYVCLVRGTGRLRALEVSLLLAIEPVASTFWAWLVHGEAPNAASLAGCAFIFASTVLQAWRSDRGAGTDL
jgi:drug/metabolite transporter (DMT)-like permease